MKQALTFTAAAAVLCCCALLFGCSPLVAAEKSVVVGFDPNFADTDSWNSDDPSDTGEAVLVARWVESLENETVIKVEDYTNKTAWRSALWRGKVVIFIENERGSNDGIKAALSTDTRTAIRDWVRNNGGAVVFCYGDTEPSRVLTGLDIFRGSGEGSLKKRGDVIVADPVSKTSDGQASDLFSSAPDSLTILNACNPWDLSNELPARSASLKCMYGSTDACYMWRYADGAGAWYGVGPDFYNWGYDGGQDGGWESVMEIIIGSANPSSAAQLSHWIQWLAALLF